MSSHPLIHALVGVSLRERLATLFEARAYRHQFAASLEELLGPPGGDLPELLVCELTASGDAIYELCASLRQDPRTTHIRVLLMADHIDAQTLLRGVEAGADEVLGGPFDEQSLGEKLAALLVDRRQAAGAPAAPRTDSKGTAPALGHQGMEAVERLAGVVAHDFNNIIMVIKGFIDIVGSSLAEDDERRQFTGEIANAAGRAAALCETLMRISGRDAGVNDAVDLSRLLDELRPRLDGELGEGIGLRIECPADIGRIAGDSEELKQTIAGMCLNAKEAMPDGGELLIDVGRAAVSYAGESESPEDGVVVELRDSGTGMSPEALLRMFEPYYTTKPAHKGLGLSFAYETMKRLGGRIECSSLVGVGTTFRLYFMNSDRGEATDAGSNGQVFDR